MLRFWATIGLFLAMAAGAPASAGMLQAVVPNYPVKAGDVPWSVGDTFPASVTLANSTLTTPANVFVNVANIRLTPSCGGSAGDGICDTAPSRVDPGVFEITNATGSGACGGRTFAISLFNATTGELQLTPSTAFHLGKADLSDGQLLCTINFTVNVLKVPTINAGGIPGHTLGLARADFSSDTPVPVNSSSWGSTSATVQAAVPVVSTTTLVADVNPANFGSPATFTATVAGAGGTPSGTVTFKDGAVTLGTGTLSGGIATFTTSTLAAGSHSITAVYGGAPSYFASTSNVLPFTVLNTGLAAGSTPIGSATNATPTIVTSLEVTCPASGRVLVTGSGESAALSTHSGYAFIGLAYSIARDSVATDNTNVVQSSALAQFNGDANRDFLNVQRVDSCTPGATYAYRLTAYRTTADTGANSFVWNGRLTASDPLSLPGTGLAAGTTLIGSADNAVPTIIGTLSVTCPAEGTVLVSGSGESAAVSTNPSTAFIGLAYSIARDSLVTDNSNVVQSSALAIFNGDANRDFLDVQRLDSCSPGSTYTYRLTAYRTTPDTGASSFVWNGRLTASKPLSLPGTGLAAGSTLVASAANPAPTIITSLTVTCPASGAVLLAGSGESAAVSTNSSTAFIGLAYSISRDSLLTDNGIVVQSSALAVFNGDANRDFLNVQRVDSCTPGLSSTYRLTAYRTTPDTSTGSFVWNGRLSSIALP